MTEMRFTSTQHKNYLDDLLKDKKIVGIEYEENLFDDEGKIIIRTLRERKEKV